MKKKPIILTLLSLLCFVEPLIKVLYFKAATHFDFIIILANLKSRNTFMEVFDFWLAFPLAGLLILKLRKWTYFAFMSVLSYIMYNILTYEKYTWPYNSETPFFYQYVVVALSAALFIYFLFPKVREPFFDRRVRWWEPQNRYAVQISAKVHGPYLTFPAQIVNISQSGAFLLDSPYMKVGEMAHLEFIFFGQVIELPVEVVHKSTIKGRTGYGVRFRFKTFTQNLRLARAISVIKKSHSHISEVQGPGQAA